MFITSTHAISDWLFYSKLSEYYLYDDGRLNGSRVSLLHFASPTERMKNKTSLFLKTCGQRQKHVKLFQKYT